MSIVKTVAPVAIGIYSIQCFLELLVNSFFGDTYGIWAVS